ncbi:hypothetical protein KEM54_002522 [Ascosphaera aggregata]|nr:hypothetical protein KEM54_002522 [Ascosphaera aggregata]
MSTDNAPVEYEQFILFGDSITEYSVDQSQGFTLHPALQNDYLRRYDVLMRGYAGYTSEQGLWALEKFFPSTKRAKVNLMAYKSCLKNIITHPLVLEQKTKIILLTPPPVNEHQLPADSPRVAWHTKKYVDACKDVGAQLNVPVVDVWTAFMHHAGWTEGKPLEGSIDLPANPRLQELFTDGLHLTAVGYKLVYEELTKTIAAAYPEETPESLPPKFIHFTEAPRPRNWD